MHACRGVWGFGCWSGPAWRAGVVVAVYTPTFGGKDAGRMRRMSITDPISIPHFSCISFAPQDGLLIDCTVPQGRRCPTHAYPLPQRTLSNTTTRERCRVPQWGRCPFHKPGLVNHAQEQHAYPLHPPPEHPVPRSRCVLPGQ